EPRKLPEEFLEHKRNIYEEAAKEQQKLQKQFVLASEKLDKNIEHFKKPEKKKKSKATFKSRNLPEEFIKTKLKQQEQIKRNLELLKKQAESVSEKLEKKTIFSRKPILDRGLAKKSGEKPLPIEFIRKKLKTRAIMQKRMNLLEKQLELASEKLNKKTDYSVKNPETIKEIKPNLLQKKKKSLLKEFEKEKEKTKKKSAKKLELLKTQMENLEKELDDL
ncbi:hypothetical protein KY317_02295, partial [Candidatus Woesearchaeota archaeon]|nr:hypothetical protein [Candidatus Woesearchaeota archaeon]